MNEFYHAGQITQLPLFSSKACSLCNEEKWLDQFYKDRTCKDGYRASCKECLQPQNRQRNREYYIAHREQKQQYQRDYYARHIEQNRQRNREYRANHIEYNKQYKQKYQKMHRDQLKQIKRNYYISNRKSMLQREKEFRAANREMVQKRDRERNKYRKIEKRELGRRYNARKRNATVGTINYKYILERDGMICHICEQEIDSADLKALHFDHVIPLARGGTHSNENVRPSHALCNLRKGTRLVEELTPFDRRGPNL